MPVINQNKSFKALKLTKEVCAIKYNYISVPSSTLQLVNKCVLCLHVSMVTLLNMYSGNTTDVMLFVRTLGASLSSLFGWPAQSHGKIQTILLQMKYTRLTDH